MQTSLRIEGANCPACFNATLEDLARLDGVRDVRGSLAGPCLEIDHDAPLDAITSVIRSRLHGVEMFANEIRMVPVEPVPLSDVEVAHCAHHHHHAETMIDPSMTLGEIVTQRPSLAADLERRGLDYCCHGGRTLADAAAAAGLDATDIAAELSRSAPQEAPAPWGSLGPVELIDDIETVHHRYLRAELPRIGALIDKIVGVHGARHPELSEVQARFGELRTDLEPHLDREEQELFPLIRQLAGAGDDRATERSDLATQIDALGDDHETVGALLEELRRLTSGYVPPPDGCATYGITFAALAQLEADTHLHVHKENNVLFPAVRELATSAAGHVG